MNRLLKNVDTRAVLHTANIHLYDQLHPVSNVQATDLATAPMTTGAPTAVVSVRPTCATPSATASPTALTKSTVNLSTRRSMVGGSCSSVQKTEKHAKTSPP